MRDVKKATIWPKNLRPNDQEQMERRCPAKNPKSKDAVIKNEPWLYVGPKAVLQIAIVVKTLGCEKGLPSQI